MPISSLIVRSTPEHVTDVADQIRAVSGASVTDIKGENVIVITDTASQDEDKQIWNQIEQLNGVCKVDLIYHNFEDVEEVNNG